MSRCSKGCTLFASLTIMSLVMACATPEVAENKAQQATAHYQLGVSYLNDNNIQPAFVEFQKALELNPQDKESLNAVGIIYLLKLEDYPKAADYFQRALRVDKSFSEASTNLGGAFEKMGRYDEAIESYRAAIANPFYRNTQNAFNSMGRAYYRLKRFSEAADAFKESIKRFSDFPLPYYGLALSYNALGRYGDAALALKRAIEKDPAYKGDRDKAMREMKEKRLLSKGDEERDLEDLLEIMNY